MPRLSALPWPSNAGSMNRGSPAPRLSKNMAQITAENAIHLPTPDENPDADVVIYDGHCKFCTGQVKNLARWDRGGKRLAFLSLHDPEVARRFPDLTYDQLMEEMYLVDQQGQRYERGEDDQSIRLHTSPL